MTRRDDPCACGVYITSAWVRLLFVSLTGRMLLEARRYPEEQGQVHGGLSEQLLNEFMSGGVHL